MYELLDNGVVD